MDCRIYRTFTKFSSTDGGELQNLKVEVERDRLVLRSNIEDQGRVTYSQISETVPLFVRQVEAIMVPRDAQIVALGHACEALISNQNFLLQNGMGPQEIQQPMPPPGMW